MLCLGKVERQWVSLMKEKRSSQLLAKNMNQKEKKCMLQQPQETTGLVSAQGREDGEERPQCLPRVAEAAAGAPAAPVG